MYILFGFHSYYPCGGIQDIISVHKTLEEAKEAGLKHEITSSMGYSSYRFDYYQIVKIDNEGNFEHVYVEEFD